MPGENSVLRWSAYEHDYVERGSDWFWALGIAAASAALTSILFHNVLFAILIALAAVILGLLANVPPDIVEFEVSSRGVRIGPSLHRFDEITAFWVEDEKAVHPHLLLNTKKLMASHLVIPLSDVDPHAVRVYLQEYAEEIPMRESPSHRILEFFGV